MGRPVSRKGYGGNRDLSVLKKIRLPLSSIHTADIFAPPLYLKTKGGCTSNEKQQKQKQMEYEMPKTYGELHSIFTRIITGELSFSDLDKLTVQDLELLFKIVTRHLETIEDRQKLTSNLLPDDIKPGQLSKGKAKAAIHMEPYRPSDDWKIISDIWIEVSDRINGPTWTERVIRKALNDNEIALYYRYLVLTGYIQPNPTQNAWLEDIARKMDMKPGSFRSTFMMYGKSSNRAANRKPALRTSLRKVALCMGSKYPDAVREIKADLKR